MNKPWIIFCISFLPAIGAELAKFMGGAYDELTTAKLVAAGMLALISGTVSGLLSLKALNTEPAPKLPPPD